MNSQLFASKKTLSSMTCLVFVGFFPAIASGVNNELKKEPSPLTITNSAPTVPVELRPVGASSISVPPIPVTDLNTAPQASNTKPHQNPNTTLIPANQQQSAPITKETKPVHEGTKTSVTESPLINQSLSEKSPSTELSPAAAIVPDVPVTQVQSSQVESNVLVPNGAALQPQLLPLNAAESSPLSSYLAGAFLVLGLAAAGVLMVRIRQGRAFGIGKAERHMQLVSCLPLSPKRQILLVKIRDKEIALASTEQGISLLTEIETQARNISTLLDDGGFEEPRKKKIQQRVVQEEPTKMIAEASENVGQETAIARSEMLMGALKNLREKNLRAKNSIPSTDTVLSQSKQAPDTFGIENQSTESLKNTSAKSEPTLKQTRAAFPKYLANAFEQESKRTLSTGSNNTNAGTDDAGSVTSMIRERLKELRPLA